MAPLRCTLIGRADQSVFHPPCVKERSDELEQSFVGHPLCHSGHQKIVIDPVEKLFEIQIHDPAVTLSNIGLGYRLSSMSYESYWPLLTVRAFDPRFRFGLSVAPPFGLGVPITRFLFVRSRFCSTLPSDAHLTATPLCFANTSPPSGCVGDLHPQAVKHARHTTKRLRRLTTPLRYVS